MSSSIFEILPHDGIQSLEPYVPGKSIEAVAKEQGIRDIIKLASNENPLGCSPHVLDALAQLSSSSLAFYPLSTQHVLHQKLAEFLGIDKTRITLSNGSDALIPLLLTLFALHQDKHMLTHDHAFIAYEINAKALGIPIEKIPLSNDWQIDIDAMIRCVNEKTALIFLANPNNPTGGITAQADIQKLLDNIPISTLLVVDEAYLEFIAEKHKINLLALTEHYPNLVLMRTFSKAYGLAGLRLGYAVAHPSITALLHRIILPFSVNTAALVAGCAALEDQAFIQKVVQNNEEGIQQLREGLSTLGITMLPSEANFITIDCQKDSMALYQSLQQHGIIVRPLHAYALPRHLRISIGTPTQLRRFLDTIKELYHA